MPSRGDRLAGRVALVTGAGQGIGEGIALAFASEGAAVGILDIDGDTAAATTARCHQRGAEAVAVVADVADRAAVAAATEAVSSSIGPIGIVVNNAQQFTLDVPLEETTEELMAITWRTGPLGALWVMQSCLPAMKAGGGSIINIGSGAGLDGDTGRGAYAAAKESLRALTRVAAREWGPFGVRVNTLCPFSSSPRWEAYAAEHPGRADRVVRSLPLRRGPGHPEHDIGRAALFLASDDAAYVTGQTLFVEGGRIRT